MKASKFFKLKALREAAQVVIETAKETLEVVEKKLEEVEQQYSANVEDPVQEVKPTTKNKVVKDA
jgi:chorismate mutase